MKALILIDVDDIENTSAQVRLIKDDEVVEMFTSKLKPMPKRKNINELLNSKGHISSRVWYREYIGYNQCIDEILGEE